MRLLITDVTTQGNLGLPPLPNSPDLYQNSKMKSCADISLSNGRSENYKILEQPCRYFTSLKLCQCSQIPQLHRVTSTSSRIKTTTIGLIIYKHSALTTLHHLACGMTEGKLLHPWGNTRKFWTHLPPSLS